MESYVVHTNYDEYAILLTKKFSHHHGPTVTAKLYGKGIDGPQELGVGGGGLRFRDRGVGRSPEFCSLVPIKHQFGEGWKTTLPGGVELGLPAEVESSSFGL